MTSQQKEIYDAIVNKSIRSFLIDRKTGEDGSSRGSTPGSMISMGSVDSSPSTDTESAPIAHSTRRRSKKRARLSYEEKSDEQFFDDVESGVNTQDDDDELSMDQRSRAFQQKTARKSVNGLKLQNLVMQLRKVCDHVRCLP
jgi:ATP-dependent DNA helicase